MALKAVLVSDVPNVGHVQDALALALRSAALSKGVDMSMYNSMTIPKFMVVGHRGHGMNVLQSGDKRTTAFKENTILSFNSAAKYPLDFIEFDVQVTKDDFPVIFHDNFIFSQDNGTVFEKRVTELSLTEFMCYGPQRQQQQQQHKQQQQQTTDHQEGQGKSLLRKTKDGKILTWDVESDDPFCTLQEAFQKVEPTLGFNIELKFDDHVVYSHEYLSRTLQSVLKVVFDYAQGRPIIFSTFQPDAALLVRKLQNIYPVFFLTNGGSEVFYDTRRNSLEEATKLCLDGGLQGIVSEVRAIFRNPEAVDKIRESKLSLLTYGKLNNVPEVVCMQHLMGIEGVIVDLVQEITKVVSDLRNPKNKDTTYSLSETTVEEEPAATEAANKELNNYAMQFTDKELAFLLKLIQEAV